MEVAPELVPPYEEHDAAGPRTLEDPLVAGRLGATGAAAAAVTALARHTIRRTRG